MSELPPAHWAVHKYPPWPPLPQFTWLWMSTFSGPLPKSHAAMNEWVPSLTSIAHVSPICEWVPSLTSIAHVSPICERVPSLTSIAHVSPWPICVWVPSLTFIARLSPICERVPSLTSIAQSCKRVSSMATVHSIAGWLGSKRVPSILFAQFTRLWVSTSLASFAQVHSPVNVI